MSDQTLLTVGTVNGLTELLDSDTVTFNAGRGDSREQFQKPLSGFTMAQAKRAFLYGAQQIFNDYRSPLLAKVKSGDATLPEGVEQDDTQSLFDYWWGNVFGQVTIRSGSDRSVTGGSVEKQAISEYLASRPEAFGKLYSERWVSDTELTPKGKAKQKAKPASLTVLRECLSAIAKAPVGDAKWATVETDIKARMGAIEKARTEAQDKAKGEEQDLEALF